MQKTDLESQKKKILKLFVDYFTTTIKYDVNDLIKMFKVLVQLKKVVKESTSMEDLRKNVSITYAKFALERLFASQILQDKADKLSEYVSLKNLKSSKKEPAKEKEYKLYTKTDIKA